MNLTKENGMAPKKSKIARRRKPFEGGKTLLNILAVILLALGQVLFFKGNLALGILLSVLALGLFLTAYLVFDSESFDGKASGAGPSRTRRGVKSGTKEVLPGWMGAWISKLQTEEDFPASRSKSGTRPPSRPSLPKKIGKNELAFLILRGMGALVALGLAAIGQSRFLQAGDPRSLHVGLAYFLAAAALFLASLWPWLREGLKEARLSPRTELVLLGLVLAVAVFLRSYQIALLPSGLFIDQGFQGLSALRILHEGWRPFYVEDIFHAYSLALYQLASWFMIFGEGEVSLKLFYAFLGLLGLPLVYWSFRQLAGPRMALLSLFVLSVMRWNYLMSRNGFPTVQMTLYMFGTLAFLLYAINPDKSEDKKIFNFAALAAGAFFVLGVFPFALFSLYYTIKAKSTVLAVLALLAALVVLALAASVLKASKNRDPLAAMLLATGFFVSGFYTYQAYKVFPLLILVWALYEAASRWKTLMKYRNLILMFLVVSLLLTLPVLFNPNSRENELSIWPHIKAEHSLRPFFDVLSRTAIMFNRQGDPNPRHNLQDYRMLDDVSGALMILGLFYAAHRVCRRKYFYALAGFFVMSLPCILSIDAAHANRLFAMTPFIAFLIAAPLAGIWGRLRAFGGGRGERIFLWACAPFLLFMTWQNFDVYFHKQAKNAACFNEYSIAETSAGRMIRDHGGNYDYFITPRYFNFFTIEFLGYNWYDQVKSMLFPDCLISHGSETSHGLYYAIEQNRTGVLDMFKTLYPEGKDQYLVDPSGNSVEYFFQAPPEAVAKVRGLTAHFDQAVENDWTKQIGAFPSGLPKGPYHAVLTGNLYIPQTGDYRFDLKGNVAAVLWLKGRKTVQGAATHLEKGEHPVKIELTAPQGLTPVLTVQGTPQNSPPLTFGAGSFDSLPSPRGLLGQYFQDAQGKGKPSMEEWDPVLNYTNGNDFSYRPNLIRWTGSVETAEAGVYRFSFNPSRSAQLKVDGKSWTRTDENSGRRLAKGPHSVEIDLVHSISLDHFSFMWVKPDGKMDVVPYSAFGRVP